MLKKYLSFLVPFTLYATTSPVNPDITVRMMDGAPVLVVNGIVQSGAGFRKIWRSVFKRFHIDDRAPKRIAIIGFGGGDTITILHTWFPRSLFTAVDIDSTMFQLATKYFRFSRHHVRCITQDAQVFVKQQREHEVYDIVVIDMFVGNDQPAFLTTQAFLRHVRSLLTPDGVVVVNYLRRQELPDHTFQHISERIFPSVEMFDIAYNRFFRLSA